MRQPHQTLHIPQACLEVCGRVAKYIGIGRQSCDCLSVCHVPQRFELLQESMYAVRRRKIGRLERREVPYLSGAEAEVQHALQQLIYCEHSPLPTLEPRFGDALSAEVLRERPLHVLCCLRRERCTAAVLEPLQHRLRLCSSPAVYMRRLPLLLPLLRLLLILQELLDHVVTVSGSPPGLSFADRLRLLLIWDEVAVAISSSLNGLTFADMLPMLSRLLLIWEELVITVSCSRNGLTFGNMLPVPSRLLLIWEVLINTCSGSPCGLRLADMRTVHWLLKAMFEQSLSMTRPAPPGAAVLACWPPCKSTALPIKNCNVGTVHSNPSRQASKGHCQTLLSKRVQ